MLNTIDQMRNEFAEEASTTRRVLSRIPEDELLWKPHPTSMPLGQLAMHVAIIPGFFTDLIQSADFDITKIRVEPPPIAGSLSEILSRFEESAQRLTMYLGLLTENEAEAGWTMRAGERVIMSMPKINVIRRMLLNHWYHHRGQLVVYFRMLGVKVPSVYGGSGDENRIL